MEMDAAISLHRFFGEREMRQMGKAVNGSLVIRIDPEINVSAKSSALFKASRVGRAERKKKRQMRRPLMKSLGDGTRIDCRSLSFLL
jgi:hypothetical protein